MSFGPFKLMSLAVYLLLWVSKDILDLVFRVKGSKANSFAGAELTKGIGHKGTEVFTTLLVAAKCYLSHFEARLFPSWLMLNCTDPFNPDHVHAD